MTDKRTDNVERMRNAAHEFIWLWDRYGDQLRTTTHLGGWSAARENGLYQSGVIPVDAVSNGAVDALVQHMREWAKETE